MSLIHTLFWLSVGVVAFAYAGYPVLVWLCSRGRRESHLTCLETPPGPRTAWPRVSLILAAYKEERWILQRLQNAVTQDYPPDRFEILVGVDGNEDTTGELVESFDESAVKLLQYPQRRGKASVLNDTVPQATGEILIFSDANTMMHPEAIRRLVRHFHDPSVGGVCGKLELTDPATGQNVDGIYWKYENFLKTCEARLESLLGVNGGIYAIRKELYQPIPTNAIIDDFLVGMRIHQQGNRLLYDVTAVAYEETPATVGAEFHRRARIGAGGYQSLAWLGSLLSPRYGWLAVCFFSHKVLRWICPAFLVTAFVANGLLVGHDFYAGLLVAQILFYAAAWTGLKLPHGQRWQRPLRLPAMFVSMNLALAVGFWRWVKGIRSGTWKRTERTEPVKDATRANV